MRYPPGHKQRTHQRILDTAAGLFRKRGYAATGVDAVMTSAGLTAGGFYAHFRSKQALLAEALELAFQRSRDHWRSRLQGREGPAWVRTHIDRKSTRLNSSHLVISYAVFCLKKKKKKHK